MEGLLLQRFKFKDLLSLRRDGWREAVLSRPGSCMIQRSTYLLQKQPSGREAQSKSLFANLVNVIKTVKKKSWYLSGLSHFRDHGAGEGILEI